MMTRLVDRTDNFLTVCRQAEIRERSCTRSKVNEAVATVRRTNVWKGKDETRREKRLQVQDRATTTSRNKLTPLATSHTLQPVDQIRVKSIREVRLRHSEFVKDRMAYAEGFHTWQWQLGMVEIILNLANRSDICDFVDPPSASPLGSPQRVARTVELEAKRRMSERT